MCVCFVAMTTGDGGPGGIEKEWLFCATRRGKTQVNAKHERIYIIAIVLRMWLISSTTDMEHWGWSVSHMLF